jgi:hypothetical protein
MKVRYDEKLNEINKKRYGDKMSLGGDKMSPDR